MRYQKIAEMIADHEIARSRTHTVELNLRFYKFSTAFIIMYIHLIEIL